MDSAGSERPQQRTALVGRELDRYKVKIATLSETHLADEGVLKEMERKAMIRNDTIIPHLPSETSKGKKHKHEITAP